MRAALLASLLLPACAAPRPAEPAKTEVLVLGMIHGGHLESERWGTREVGETIRRMAPDVVCCEIPPDRWDRVARDWSERGVVEDDRVLRFPEYTDALLPLWSELGFAVEPCAAWTSEMAAERSARIEEFETDPLHADALAEYRGEVAEIEARHAAEPLDDGDPYVIHSAEYDRRAAEELEPYDRWLNDFIGAGGWTNVNRAHWALIADALERHAGERVLITFGAGHKYWFLERLRERPDVRLVDVTSYLPPRAAQDERAEPGETAASGRSATGQETGTTDATPTNGAGAADEEETMDASLDELCRREVVGLHRFLQDWFNGEVPATEEVLERFTDVLDPEFRMIWPDGTASERSAVVERVAAGHGAHWKSDPPFSIAITAVRGRPLSEDLCLVTYEEWQRHGEEAQGRISTALFRRDPDAPNGVRWLHVHETWLPEDAQQGD